MGKYLAAFLNEVKLNFKYRANLLVGTTYLIVPFVSYAFLWATVYRHGGQLGTYSGKEILTYYLYAVMLSDAMPIFAYHDITVAIKNGRLSYFLLKPMSFVGYYFAVLLGASLTWMVAGLIGISPFIFIFRHKLLFPSLLNLVWGAIFFVIAFAISFLSGVIFNFLTFWVGDPFGFSQLWGLVIALFGGEVLPLDLIPFGAISNFLPFRFVFYIPVQTLMGRIPLSNIILNLAIGLLWILILRLIVQVMWIKGLRRYEAYGG